MIRSFTTAAASRDLLSEIQSLIVEVFEGDFSEADWEQTLGGDHVIVVEGDSLIAHAAAVPRTLEVGGRPFRAGYLEGVATAATKQRQGLGTQAVIEISKLVRSKYEMGGLSTGRHSFYERLGWERWLGASFVRNGAELVRTEEEDSGLMVLRFGPSKDIDLTLSLTCESRSGDDW